MTSKHLCRYGHDAFVKFSAIRRTSSQIFDTNLYISFCAGAGLLAVVLAHARAADGGLADDILAEQVLLHALAGILLHLLFLFFWRLSFIAKLLIERYKISVRS